MAVGIALVALALYWPSGEHAFVTFDDPLYLYDNPRVVDGLTLESMGWAFRSTELGNWHPLTWLSHLLDVSLFGLDAGAHHRVNALLHGVAAALLFLWLNAATKRPWLSLAVGLLLAVHPLHVESVAWASERKDVLSALFGHAAILAYVKRGGRVGPGVVLLHAASLMAKPTLVTLPLLLLFVDRWPLDRRPRLVEKWPLFLLSIASGVTTFLVQQAGGAVRTLDSFPPIDRAWNALLSLWIYPRQMLWPFDLSFFYPYPVEVPWIPLGISAALTIGACVLAWRWRECGRWFTFGWCWYLVALVPMIGIVQVGSQAHADRYAYIPLVGLYVAIVWWVDGVVPRKVWVGLAAVLFVLLCVRTRDQLSTWRDSESLYTHAIAVTEDNYIAHDALGYFYRENDRPTEAIEQYEQALAIRPELSTSLNNLGVVRAGRGESTQAVALYRRAIEADPDYAAAHNNLGISLAQKRDYEGAIVHLARAIELEPVNAEALFNLGLIHRARGESGPMAERFEAALALRPDWHDVAVELAWVRATARESALRDGDRAVELAEAAVASDPNNVRWIDVLAAAYAETGRFDEAIATQSRVIERLRQLGQQVPPSTASRLELYRSRQPFRS